ncbi:acetolactate synthase [Methanobrevibacter sp. TMH8]|uniref:ACT domain-containing protein n=1 Tax=Methanobrevibacter sp. TMH8 TaxID=2848611 RepID=UPI001CC90184|nr:ACT domain-containing protein [Methanobrevibacter sp. TMH8]MBZ9570910.1 acetolactate synthase [Methanobrevibacter sp. TMH8]
MKISQLSIFLENKEGRLWNALDALAIGGINIRALSLADTSEFGILRLIVQDPEKAKKILEDNNFIVKIIEVAGIELDDTPGGLATVLKILNDNNINLEYLYAFTHEKTEKAILLLQSNDLNLLLKVLKENNVSIVPPEEVYNL